MWKFLFEINKPCGGEYYSKLELPRDWLEFHIALSKNFIWDLGIRFQECGFGIICISLECIVRDTWKKLNFCTSSKSKYCNIEKSICEESCIVFGYITWNTVSKALVIESKFDVGLPSGKLNWPPNNWNKKTHFKKGWSPRDHGWIRFWEICP